MAQATPLQPRRGAARERKHTLGRGYRRGAWVRRASALSEQGARHELKMSR